MDVTKIENKISSRTRAIIAPHIYGLPIDMDPLLKIAKKNNLKVIEDAAEVLGLKYKNKECGSFGDISTFSFYLSHHISTMEGGMLLTNNEELFEIFKSMRIFGSIRDQKNQKQIAKKYPELDYFFQIIMHMIHWVFDFLNTVKEFFCMIVVK